MHFNKDIFHPQVVLFLSFIVLLFDKQLDWVEKNVQVSDPHSQHPFFCLTEGLPDWIWVVLDAVVQAQHVAQKKLQIVNFSVRV